MRKTFALLFHVIERLCRFLCFCLFMAVVRYDYIWLTITIMIVANEQQQYSGSSNTTITTTAIILDTPWKHWFFSSCGVCACAFAPIQWKWLCRSHFHARNIYFPTSFCPFFFFFLYFIIEIDVFSLRNEHPILECIACRDSNTIRKKMLCDVQWQMTIIRKMTYVIWLHCVCWLNRCWWLLRDKSIDVEQMTRNFQIRKKRIENRIHFDWARMNVFELHFDSFVYDER